MKHSSQKGFSLVEVLLAVSVLGLLVLALVGALIYSNQTAVSTESRQKATFIAKEGLAAAASIRDDDFARLVNGQYGIAIINNLYDFSGSSDTSENYTRVVEISDIDLSTKQVKVTVSWDGGLNNGEVELISYLTDWR